MILSWQYARSEYLHLEFVYVTVQLSFKHRTFGIGLARSCKLCTSLPADNFVAGRLPGAARATPAVAGHMCQGLRATLGTGTRGTPARLPGN